MIFTDEQIEEFRTGGSSLWWLMDAKRYKEEQQRKKTELLKAEFEIHVTNALGGKY